MASGPPAPPPAFRQALILASGLGAASAWLVAASTAWSRWNALSLGPICGEPHGALTFAGHCAACPLAVALTAVFALTLVQARRDRAAPMATAG